MKYAARAQKLRMICEYDNKMSEEKIRELYRQLPDKRIAMAKARAEKAEPSILIKFDREIIAIRREIFLELQTLEKSFQKEE